MSGGYSKNEVIANLRNRRKTNLDELHEIAYNSKGKVHKYAEVEAKREIMRRITGKTIKHKEKSINPFHHVNAVEKKLREMF